MTLPNGVEPPVGLNRTEKVFYRLLADGKPHSADEMTKYLWDELGVNLRQTIRVHIHNIRKKLPAGEYLTTLPIQQVFHYMLVRGNAQTPPAAPQTENVRL